MGYANIPIMLELNLKNLKYYVLKNNCYASTGGQRALVNYLSVDNLLEVSDEKGDSPRIKETLDYFFKKVKNDCI
jgi:hypothetical protein